jgi:hypothetical protein
MMTNLKSVVMVVPASDATLYVCPVNTKAVVNTMIFFNSVNTGSNNAVKLCVFLKTGDKRFQLLKTVIPSLGRFIEKEWTLEPGDAVIANADLVGTNVKLNITEFPIC